MQEANKKIIDLTEHIIGDKSSDSFILELFGDTKKAAEIIAFVIVLLWLWRRYKEPIMFLLVCAFVAVSGILGWIMLKLGII